MTRVLRAKRAQSFFLRNALQSRETFRVVPRSVHHHIDGRAARMRGITRPRHDGAFTRASLLVQEILSFLRASGLDNLHIVPVLVLHAGHDAIETLL